MLLHELQVHQIELEMQNEELRRAQAEIEVSRARYFELYDLAPVGYFTVSEKGLILEANLIAASLLGVSRNAMGRQPLTRFILREDQDIYYNYRKKLFETGEPQVCELRMMKADDIHFIVRMEAVRAQDADGSQVSLIVVNDITKLKHAEEKVKFLATFPQLNPSPVMEVDVSGAVTFANPATQKILDSLGMDAGDFRAFLPHDLDAVIREWDKKTESTLYREISVKDWVFAGTVQFIPQFGVARIYAHDITLSKLAEKMLKENEKRVTLILESLVSPEGDVGNLELADIIDVPTMRSLMEDFHGLARLPVAIIDLKGKVLVGVGWQDICTKFHRVHPETCKHCIESDTQLSAGVQSGEANLYRCRNGMYDIATPIMVGGVHMGNVFSGQFFFEGEPLDYKSFRAQAGHYGFDEKEYIAALERVPRVSRKFVDTVMAFLLRLADVLSQLSYSNIKLVRSSTDRELLMNSLSISEERFRTMFERHKAIMLLIEPKTGAIIDANEAAAGFYGHSRRELCSMKIQDINQMSTDQVTEERQKAVQEQRNYFVFPHRLADGEIRWVEAYSSPVDIKGTHLLFSVIHDITERKLADEKIEALNEILNISNRKLAARTEDLEFANKELESFSSSVSHDLRAPLRHITGFIGLLRKNCEGQLDEAARHYADVIEEASTKMGGLIDDLLNFSRTGRLEMRKGKISMKVLVETAILEVTAAEKGRKIDWKVEDLPLVYCDQAMLKLALVNLISNAVKFTRKCPQAEIEIGCKEESAERVYHIRDNGVGFDMRHADRLFGVFQRLHDQSEFEGTGIGLANVHRIILRHGGRIWAEGEVGHGATFYFTLPKEAEV
jgi:PAS domain S-box-containing protein